MNEHEPEDAFCLNCGSTDLYRDETSDDLICNVCNTKSQSLSQRETADDDLMTLLGRSNLHKTKSSSEVRVEDDFYTKDHVLPSLFDCTEAFLTVVEMAARRSVSPDLMPLPMTMQYDQLRQDVVNTAKEILLLYLERFDESANYFMVKYPKLRISLKDRFLTDAMREKVWLSLHVQNDKDNDNDNDKDRGSGDEEQTHLLSQISAADTPTRKQRSPKRVKWSDSQHSNNVPIPESQDLSLSLSPIVQETDTDTNTDANNEQRTKSFLTEHGFIGRNRTHGLRQLTNTDDSLLWKLTVLEMRLDLNFLTSVVYLAHLCCQTGISSHHFIIWASSSSPSSSSSSSSSSTECQYPFLQDCFQSLHPNQQKKMHHIRESFVSRSMDLPDASVLDIGAILLLSCIIDMSGREDDEDEIPSLFRLNIERMKCMEILESDKKISRFLRGDRNIDTFQKKRRGRGSKTPVPENRRITQSQIRLQEVEEEAKSVGRSGGGGDGTQSSMSSQETVLQLGQMSQESQQSRESDENDQDDDDDNNTTSSCEGPDRYSLAPQSEAFYNTGMMAARFCAYLGVDDKVLDFSHALMGLPVYCSKDDHALEEWLPSPLKLAHPSMLVSPLHVIAVIVVACKFTPGWMEWKVFRNISNGRTSDDNNEDDDSDSDSDASHDEDSISSEEGLNFLSSKRRKGRRKQQYVSRAKRKKVARKTTPMGETPQFIEKHCPMRFDYLDFMSTMTNGTNEDEKKTISDYFKDTLSFSFGKTYGNNAGKDIPIVKANPIIGGATVDHATATATVETPELNESNGLSDYLPYPTVKKVSQRGGNEAVHGPYKALLGYFANRLFVDKHLLHYLVTLLDEEIQINAAKRERNNIATRTSTNNV